MIHVLRPGEGATLVCVHPGDGQIDHYQPLAAELAWPGPILGVEAEPGVRSLEELAALYADQLALLRPTVLLGWAVGGVIAAELSRVLVERGHAIAHLAVLDSRVPQPEMRARPTDRETLARFFLYQRAMIQERTPPACDLTDEVELERRLQLFSEVNRAFLAHEQRPVPIAVDLFEATDAAPSHPKPPTLGWDGLTPRLVKHSVAGTHFTLLAPRYCGELARAISATLDTP